MALHIPSQAVPEPNGCDSDASATGCIDVRLDTNIPRISIHRHSAAPSTRDLGQYDEASPSDEEHATPTHPIPLMQDAFLESITESHDPHAMYTRNSLDAAVRRLQLIELDEFSDEYSSRWQQRSTARFHPLWKIIAQVSFGVHLLHHSQAKSADEVISILQDHIHEVDGFIEDATADFTLALTDVEDRRRLLEMPLSHGRTFDRMLRDSSFRSSIIDGNEIIERIVRRTGKAMRHSLRDVRSGVDATAALHEYLEGIGPDWPQNDEELVGIYVAMHGNAEGWYRAFKAIEKKAKDLKDAMRNLDHVVNEVSKRAADASRKRVMAEQHSRRKESSGTSSTISVGAQSAASSTSTKADKPLPPPPSASRAEAFRHTGRHSSSRSDDSPRRVVMTSIQPAIAQVKTFRRVHSPASTVRSMESSTSNARSPSSVPQSPPVRSSEFVPPPQLSPPSSAVVSMGLRQPPSPRYSSPPTCAASSTWQHSRPASPPTKARGLRPHANPPLRKATSMAVMEFEPPAGVQLSLEKDRPRRGSDSIDKSSSSVSGSIADGSNHRESRFSDKEMVVSTSDRPRSTLNSQTDRAHRLTGLRMRSPEALHSHSNTAAKMSDKWCTDSDKEVISTSATFAASLICKPFDGQGIMMYEEKEVVPDSGLELAVSPSTSPPQYHSTPLIKGTGSPREKEGSRRGLWDKPSSSPHPVTSREAPRAFRTPLNGSPALTTRSARVEHRIDESPSRERSSSVSMETTALPVLPPRQNQDAKPQQPPSPKSRHGLRKPSLVALKDMFGSKRQPMSRKVVSGGLGGLSAV